MLMHGHGEISEAVHIHADVWIMEKFLKLCIYKLMCDHGEITEALDIHERTC